MRVVDKGHTYALDKVEDPTRGIAVRFIKKQEEDGELITKQDGTTNEEVLRMMIHRLEYLQEKLPCEENEFALTGLRHALGALQLRQKKREKQEVEGTNQPHK